MGFYLVCSLQLVCIQTNYRTRKTAYRAISLWFTISLYVLQENCRLIVNYARETFAKTYRLIINYRLIAREIFVKTYRLIINYRLIAWEIYLKTCKLIINYRLIAKGIFLKTSRLIIHYRLIFKYKLIINYSSIEEDTGRKESGDHRNRESSIERRPLQVSFQIPECELRWRVLWKWLQSNVKTVLIWISTAWYPSRVRRAGINEWTRIKNPRLRDTACVVQTVAKVCIPLNRIKQSVRYTTNRCSLRLF